ncbi:MAG: hypothetical protein QM770_07985 [Tepidisphaeraceae bacterium]
MSLEAPPRRPTWAKCDTAERERLRSSAGLIVNADGWYKKVDQQKRYIAKPMPLDDVMRILPRRLQELRCSDAERKADSDPLIRFPLNPTELGELLTLTRRMVQRGLTPAEFDQRLRLLKRSTAPGRAVLRR